MGTHETPKDVLKDIFRDIHAGADPELLQEKFRQRLGSVDAETIGKAEQELVEEGLPREDLKRLCDVHLAVMGKDLQDAGVEVEPGHPLHTLKEEHRHILGFLDHLEKTAAEIKESPRAEIIAERIPILTSIADHLMEVERHNLREENVLFPYLEKHGIIEPPAVMWSEHDDLRAMKKRLKAVIESHSAKSPDAFARDLNQVTGEIVRTLSGHIFKENNVLYPMALQALEQHEWPAIREECDELGYCCFTPETAKAPQGARASSAPVNASSDMPGKISFPTGSLTHEELEWTLNTLPVEITFVDKDDVFRYFSGTEDRAFARARASIGRKVQNCHPSKSIDLVNGILDDFRQGRKKSEHFRVHLGGKFLHISYYAVRNGDGEYLGTLETIQDIAPLQELSGDKRER